MGLEAHSLGMVLEDDMIRQASAAKAEVDKLKMVMEAEFTRTLATLAPVVRDVAGGLSSVAGVADDVGVAFAALYGANKIVNGFAAMRDTISTVYAGVTEFEGRAGCNRWRSKIPRRCSDDALGGPWVLAIGVAVTGLYELFTAERDAWKVAKKPCLGLHEVDAALVAAKGSAEGLTGAFKDVSQAQVVHEIESVKEGIKETQDSTKELTLNLLTISYFAISRWYR